MGSCNSVNEKENSSKKIIKINRRLDVDLEGDYIVQKN